MDLVQILWSSLGSIVEGRPPRREHRSLVGHVAPGVSQDVPTLGPSGRAQFENWIHSPGHRSSQPKSMVQPCRDDAVQVERERGRRRHPHIGLLAFGVPFVAVLQKHAGPHRTARAARRAAVVNVKDMGTVAVQTQCCLKTDESEDDDDVAHEEGTAVQLVDHLRFSKPAANAAGKFVAPPVLPRAHSEASTVFVP